MSFRLSLAIFMCHAVYAAPSHSRSEDVLQPRASSSDSPGSQPSGLSVQVWAPLVAITVVIIVMIIFSCIKRRKYSLVTAAARANIARANGSTTELTAELLSGSSGATVTPGGRSRRTRRTPSQISTRSLPAYMEDPGDSEMVLVRGARDMDDPMPTVQEGADTSHNTSDSLGTLGDLNTVAQNSQTNLLNAENNLSPPTEADARVSFDTVRTGSESEDSHRALLQPSRHSRQLSAEEIQAMGEAPPYFEVVSEVDLAEGMGMQGMRSPIGAPIIPDVVQAAPSTPEAATPRAATPEPSPASEAGDARPSGRRSGFRSFAARLSQLMPSSSSGPLASSASTISLESHTADRATSPTSPPGSRHRPSPSGSGSTINLSTTSSHGLPRSRSIRSLRSNSSAVNLTSPSVASLGLISAPLPHTLVRTEFAYPRGGPTSEQMKFLSSRETVGKFGVPYGLAAQAQALASREALAMSLDTEPPPFESPVAEAGPSATRPEGNDAAPSSSEAVGSGHTRADDSSPPPDVPMLEPPGTAASDAMSSLSSNRDSVVTFETATEGLSSSEEDTKHLEHTVLEAQARGPTPIPAGGPLTINIDGVATKSVPTPPPTPPRQSLVVPAPDVPSIVIAPASPAA